MTRTGITSLTTFAVKTTPIPRPKTGIYPNPAKNTLNVVLDLNIAGPVVFSVYDEGGRLILRKQENLATGVSQTTLDLRRLSIGVHTLKVSIANGPEFMVRKFVVAR